MTRSPVNKPGPFGARPRGKARPRPVATGRYRYTRWRWRIAVGAFDLVGSILMSLWRWVRPDLDRRDPRKILVVQLDHLGDAMLSSPIFPRLRRAYPGASIEVLASPSNREVFEADPHVDRVHLADRNWFERKPGRRAMGSAVWTLGRKLRPHGFDLGIDVRGDILTVIVLVLAGIPRRLGWAMGGGGFLLTDVARWVPGRHEVESRMALLARLGIAADEADPPRVAAYPTDRDRASVARRFRRAWPDRVARRRSTRLGVGSASKSSASRGFRLRIGPDRLGDAPAADGPGRWPDDPDRLHAGRFGDESPIVAVHMGAGAPAKRWPARNWRDLVGRFLEDGWRVVVVGGPDGSAEGVGLEPHPDLVDWSGRLPLAETAALLERADLFIGSDSGPAHVAAASAVASVILFSGTNRSEQWRPWSDRSLVLREEVSCHPCHHKACPLADHPCMTGLTPDRVYRAARRWWGRQSRDPAGRRAV